jgi:putative DNA primase/helicase
VFVCSAMNLVGRSRDERSGAWSIVVEFPDQAGTLHRHKVSMAALESEPKTVRAELADAGLRISHTADGKGFLARLLATGGRHRVIRTFSRPGWHGGTFVAPSGVIIPRTEQDCELALDAMLKDTKPGGTFEGWKAAVAAPLTRRTTTGPSAPPRASLE